MRLTIFETTTGSGHQLTYVRQMLGALLDDRGGKGPVVEPGEITVALMRGAVESEAFEHQVRPGLEGVGLHVMDEAGEVARGIAGARARRGLLERAIADTEPTRLLIPTADGLAQAIGTMPGVVGSVERVDLVMHRGSFAYPASSLRERVAKRVGLWAMGRARNAQLHFVDVLAWEWLDARAGAGGGGAAGRSGVLPDPVDAVEPRDKRAARERLGLPVEAPLIVSAGVQDTRKGLIELITALAAARRSPELDGARVVLAGSIKPAVRAWLDAQCDAVRAGVIEMDRYLSNDELADAIAAADVVAACQPAHVGLSNVALRGVAAGRPCLGSDFGWFGRVIPAFGVGWTGPVRDAEAFAETIRVALRESPAWEAGDAASALTQFHSPQNFRATVQNWFGGEEPVMTWPEAVAVT